MCGKRMGALRKKRGGFDGEKTAFRKSTETLRQRREIVTAQWREKRHCAVFANRLCAIKRAARWILWHMHRLARAVASRWETGAMPAHLAPHNVQSFLHAWSRAFAGKKRHFHHQICHSICLDVKQILRRLPWKCANLAGDGARCKPDANRARILQMALGPHPQLPQRPAC